MITISDFFRYFEKKYEITLTTFQKKMFMQILQTRKCPYFVRNGKTLVQKMILEYQEYKRREKNGSKNNKKN